MDIEEKNDLLKEEADKIKAKGNEQFKKDNYLRAIELYTKAIGNFFCFMSSKLRCLFKRKELLWKSSSMFSESEKVNFLTQD